MGKVTGSGKTPPRYIKPKKDRSSSSADSFDGDSDSFISAASSTISSVMSSHKKNFRSSMIDDKITSILNIEKEIKKEEEAFDKKISQSRPADIRKNDLNKIRIINELLNKLILDIKSETEQWYNQPQISYAIENSDITSDVSTYEEFIKSGYIIHEADIVTYLASSIEEVKKLLDESSRLGIKTKNKLQNKTLKSDLERTMNELKSNAELFCSNHIIDRFFNYLHIFCMSDISSLYIDPTKSIADYTDEDYKYISMANKETQNYYAKKAHQQIKDLPLNTLLEPKTRELLTFKKHMHSKLKQVITFNLKESVKIAEKDIFQAFLDKFFKLENINEGCDLLGTKKLYKTIEHSKEFIEYFFYEFNMDFYRRGYRAILVQNTATKKWYIGFLGKVKNENHHRAEYYINAATKDLNLQEKTSNALR